MPEVERRFGRLPRAEVDPNITAGNEGTLSVVRLANFDLPIKTGDSVVVVQADEDDADLLGYARVERISERGLVYLKVDWNSFRPPIV